MADTEKMLDIACEMIADYTGSCPYDMYDMKFIGCDENCTDDLKACWRKYLEMKARDNDVW